MHKQLGHCYNTVIAQLVSVRVHVELLDLDDGTRRF